jgi:hypothetical protein
MRHKPKALQPALTTIRSGLFLYILPVAESRAIVFGTVQKDASSFFTNCAKGSYHV